MTKAVFFDLDDTLCDAQTAFDQASQVAFDTICRHHPLMTRQQVIDAWQSIHVSLFAEMAAGRLSMAEVRTLRFRRLLGTLNVADDKFADEVDLLLGHTQLQLLKPFDDLSAIEELHGRGLYVGIITNGAGDEHPDSQRSKANHLGLVDRVDSFFVSDEIGHRKPDSRAFVPALRAANCEPQEAIYVGDSIENDVRGSNRAGMVSVLLWRSDRPVPETAGETRPRFVVSSLAEVERLAFERH